MVRLTDKGIDAGDDRLFHTIDSVYHLSDKFSELGWPGYVPKVTAILDGVGIKYLVDSGAEASHREMTKLRAWDGKQYIWDDTVIEYADEVGDNLRRLQDAGWVLHSFAAADVSEMAVHNQGLLAYEPGLGKTRASLAWAFLKQPTCTLIVAPRRLHRQWVAEIAKTPFTIPYIMASYTDLWRFENTYPNCDLSILDEVHAIKNPNTLRYKAAMQLDAHMRLGLTGTPTGGYVGDLDGVIRWISGKAPFINTLGPDFREKYGVVSGNKERPGLRMGKNLRASLAHIMKTRSRSEPEVQIANQKPVMFMQKLDIEERLGKFYLQNARAIRGWWFTKEARNEAMARMGLSRLIKAASMPQSLSGWGNETTRLQRHVVDLAQISGSGTIVLASHIATAQFYAEKLGTTAITSRLPLKRRGQYIDTFNQNGGHIVGTIGVLGEGYNLQKAHTIVFAELDWKAWLVVQAMYRIIRPGQKYVPTIVFVMYKNTVGDYMSKMIAAKAQAMRGAIIGRDSAVHIPRFSETLRLMIGDVARRKEGT